MPRDIEREEPKPVQNIPSTLSPKDKPRHTNPILPNLNQYITQSSLTHPHVLKSPNQG